MVQFSHPFVTTGKIIALTLRTFVSKGVSLLFNTLPRSVPPLVRGQSLPLPSGSVFRQPVAQHFHSMAPKPAVRARAQHGSGRQQFWEGLPEHRLEASWMPPLSWDLPETPPGKAMPYRSPGARNLSSLDVPGWAWRLPWWIFFLSTSPPGWSRTSHGGWQDLSSKWLKSQWRLSSLSLPANAGDTSSIPGPGRFHLPRSN